MAIKFAIVLPIRQAVIREPESSEKINNTMMEIYPLALLWAIFSWVECIIMRIILLPKFIPQYIE